VCASPKRFANVRTYEIKYASGDHTMNRSDDPFLAQNASNLVEALARVKGPGASAPALGRLHGFGPDEQPLVAGLRAAAGRVIAACSIVRLGSSQVGRNVLVVFEDADAKRPIIVGVLEPAPMVRDDEVTAPTAIALAEATRDAASGQVGSPRGAVHLRVDGEERVVIEAQRELVLRCGAASVTLTRAGKVIIEGTYILSRSSGYNKIKGAAIDIN
jgi:hypothetical protein